MTKQITPEILQRALDQERRGERPTKRSALKQLLSRMAAKGNWLVVVTCSPSQRIARCRTGS